jgi:hypothetical protein
LRRSTSLCEADLRKKTWGRIAGAFCVVAAFVAGPALAAPGLLGACASAQSGTVAVVVDFGTVPGGPGGGPVVRCVSPGSPNTGAQALADAGFRVRYGPSGLLCAINDYPATGCGERTDSRQYKYWAYWRKSVEQPAAWTYASIGPASARVEPGDVEGWRFVDGNGSPTDPQPRSTPDQVALCGVTAPPAPPPGGPSPSPPGGGGSGGSGSSSSSPGAGPTGPAGESSPPSTDATGLPVGDPSTGTTPVPDASVLGQALDGPGSAGVGEGAALDESAAAAVQEDAADAGTSGGVPWGPLLLAVVIVALGVGAFAKFRTSAPDP